MDKTVLIITKSYIHPRGKVRGLDPGREMSDREHGDRQRPQRRFESSVNDSLFFSIPFFLFITWTLVRGLHFFPHFQFHYFSCVCVPLSTHPHPTGPPRLKGIGRKIGASALLTNYQIQMANTVLSIKNDLKGPNQIYKDYSFKTNVSLLNRLLLHVKFSMLHLKKIKNGLQNLRNYGTSWSTLHHLPLQGFLLQLIHGLFIQLEYFLKSSDHLIRVDFTSLIIPAS